MSLKYIKACGFLVSMGYDKKRVIAMPPISVFDELNQIGFVWSEQDEEWTEY
jgi:hypothetical protein